MYVLGDIANFFLHWFFEVVLNVNVHGVGGLQGENTNDVMMQFVKEEMDIDIGNKDLDQTHRVGNPKVCKEGKWRPIIVKFDRYDVPSVWK